MKKLLILIFYIFKFAIGTTVESGLQIAQQNESPWFSLIYLNKDRTDLCGGSLYNNFYVITAAHCFDSLPSYKDDKKNASIIDSPLELPNIKVIFGEWKTNTDPDCDGNNSEEWCDTTAEKSVESIMIHPAYSASNEGKKFFYDIAIIKLKTDPRLSDLIQNIQLPSESRCDMDIQENWMFTGFGQLTDGSMATIKKKIELSVASYGVCKNRLGYKNNKNISRQIVCGSNPGISTCKGDSGSGITRSFEGNTYLEGLVSFGSSECHEGVIEQTGLLKVSCFYPWIKKITDDKDDEEDNEVDRTESNARDQQDNENDNSFEESTD